MDMKKKIVVELDNLSHQMDSGVIAKLKFMLRPPVDLTLVNTTDMFTSIRNIILGDQHNQNILQDDIAKLDQIRYDNGEKEIYGSKYEIRNPNINNKRIPLTRGYSLEDRMVIQNKNIQKHVIPEKDDIKKKADIMINAVSNRKDTILMDSKPFIKLVKTHLDIKKVFLDQYSDKKADLYNQLILLMQNLLSYKKDNILDIFNILLYICGFRHPHIVVIYI